MPQHPDSYELSPHWTMVGEHGFRGEVIPHPTHLIRLGAEPQPEPPDICSQMEQMELPQPTMFTGIVPEGEELWSSQTTLANGWISPITSGPLGDELCWAISSAQHYEFGSMIRIWRNGQNYDVWPTFEIDRRVVKVAKCGEGGRVYTIICG